MQIFLVAGPRRSARCDREVTSHRVGDADVVFGARNDHLWEFAQYFAGLLLHWVAPFVEVVECSDHSLYQFKKIDNFV